MPSWTLNRPPYWAPNAVADQSGWRDESTNELLVAIRQLDTKAGAADILSVSFDAASYAQGDALSVSVKFNEKVSVSDGASIVISTTGLDETITLYAVEQLSTSEVVFAFAVDLETAVLVPAEAATLSIEDQTVGGDIEDADSAALASNKAISEAIALAAGTRVVPEV